MLQLGLYEKGELRLVQTTRKRITGKEWIMSGICVVLFVVFAKIMSDTRFPIYSPSGVVRYLVVYALLILASGYIVLVFHEWLYSKQKQVYVVKAKEISTIESYK